MTLVGFQIRAIHQLTKPKSANPHWMRETHTQHQVNGWSGLIGSNVIGPFVIDRNLNLDT
ncbi:hypothetical protein J6590_084334 [Homalodisca vitripennis]|nr:hypothetical protein J6590_084334 [Homalodisca vitripennis]